MQSFRNDLTEGNVARQLIKFSIPFLASTIIQQLYSMADLMIVGWYSGADSIAGVNIGGQLTNFANALAIGMSVGGTVLVGQYFGAKREDDVHKAISTMFSMLIIMAVILTILFLLLDTNLLMLLRTPETSVGEAKAYLDICLIGLVFIFMYNAISGVLRGMGDSVRPLYFVGGACVLNVFLDIWFIGGLKMGAAGAAIATVVSQAASVVVSAVYLAKRGFMFDFKLSSFKIHMDKLRLILKLGIPTGVQQAITNISFMVMTYLVNGYGVEASAGIGVVGKFNGFAIMPAIAVSNSVAMMSAQNFGANRIDRARHTLNVGIILSLAVSILAFIIAQFFPREIMGIFTRDEAVIEIGAIYMRTFSYDYLIVPFVFNMGGFINGSGHTLVSSACSMMSSIGFRIPAAILLSEVLSMGISGVGLAAPIASIGSGIILIIYIARGAYKKF